MYGVFPISEFQASRSRHLKAFYRFCPLMLVWVSASLLLEANATTLRTEEEMQSSRAIAEYGDAVTILTSAMNVLQEAFAEKATAGNTIIGILEVGQQFGKRGIPRT